MKKFISKFLFTFMLLALTLLGATALPKNAVFADTIPSLRITDVGQTTKIPYYSTSDFFDYGPITNFQINNHADIKIGTQYPVIHTLLTNNSMVVISVYVDGNYLGQMGTSESGTELIEYNRPSSNSYENELIFTNLTPGTHFIKLIANPTYGYATTIQDYAEVTVTQ